MGMTNALNLLCGLALFLYGMHVMGEGLTRASGGKLESILESLTKSKIKAVLLGAGVTAIIQSSSATTVMVVGFVNSGIMRLSQAAGVIMGANIGTTVTSWILSLSGLQGDSLLLTLCKPATFTPVLAFIGVCLLLLLETLTVVAELADLKANPNRYAYGSVVEGKLDKGRGAVATLLVENGTLRASDPIVVGAAYGRVRQMLDDKGRVIKEALPGTPVEITGLNEVPVAGDKFMVFETEKQARSVGETRMKAKIEKDRNSGAALSLDDLYSQIKEGQIIDLNIIVKADVQGTAEAVKASLEKIDVDGVRVNVIRSTVGAISESDVILASASQAIIYGFNVRPDAKVRNKAEEENVEIRLHNVIYKMVEEIETAMKGMLAPEYHEVITGQAEIRQVIKASKVGNIAGCYVTDGSIKRNCGIRLIRDGIVVYEGKLASLRRFKDDVKEVNAGFECGLNIENYNDIKEGDIIEGYVMEEVEKK